MNTDRSYQFMVIDDHPFIRDGIINFIKSHSNFELFGEFGDVRSVLNSSFSGRPDVIVLDLNLPGMDGEKSCPLLKQKFMNCKIVAFTHYEGLQKELQELGFDGYVVKSERDILIDALITVLNGEKYFKKDNLKTGSSLPEFDKMDDFLKLKKLTPREIEIAKYIVNDYSNREIADKISISEDTVKTHRKHIKEKLKPKNKREFFSMLRSYIGGN